MKRTICALILGIGSLPIFAAPASAAPIVINFTDSGWYNHTGFHDPDNPNYVAGQASHTFRNFFVFDLSGVSGTIVSATLRLSTLDYQGDASETYDLYDVTTPIGTLRAGGIGLVGIYNDLGSGTGYGSRVYTVADENLVRDIVLNGAALGDIQAALGELFAIGGTLSTASSNQWLFGNSGNPPDVRQLILEVASVSAPEPASIVLLGLGLLGMARARRHLRG